jgi:hypothetical protein
MGGVVVAAEALVSIIHPGEGRVIGLDAADMFPGERRITKYDVEHDTSQYDRENDHAQHHEKDHPTGTSHIF